MSLDHVLLQRHLYIPSTSQFRLVPADEFHLLEGRTSTVFADGEVNLVENAELDEGKLAEKGLCLFFGSTTSSIRVA